MTRDGQKGSNLLLDNYLQSLNTMQAGNGHKKTPSTQLDANPAVRPAEGYPVNQRH